MHTYRCMYDVYTHQSIWTWFESCTIWSIDHQVYGDRHEAVRGFFAVGQFAVRKKKTNLIWPNLTETNIFFCGELSHGEKSTHAFMHGYRRNLRFCSQPYIKYLELSFIHGYKKKSLNLLPPSHQILGKQTLHKRILSKMMMPDPNFRTR